MKFSFIWVFFLLIPSWKVLANEEVNMTLDSFHQAAADADFERYFDLFADSGIYMGTDASERWTKEQFKAFVKPYFSKGRGWLYTVKERHVSPTSTKQLVFFDELLENKFYGQCRGSGVLMKINNHWQILQYNLSIPVPNAIAGEVVDDIRNYRINKLISKKNTNE